MPTAPTCTRTLSRPQGVVPVDVRRRLESISLPRPVQVAPGSARREASCSPGGSTGPRAQDLLYPSYVYFNYPPWVDRPDSARRSTLSRASDATRYHPATSTTPVSSPNATFRWMESMGIDKISEHTLRLAGGFATAERTALSPRRASGLRRRS
jgi:hypothetical protein